VLRSTDADRSDDTQSEPLSHSSESTTNIDEPEHVQSNLSSETEHKHDHHDSNPSNTSSSHPQSTTTNIESLLRAVSTNGISLSSPLPAHYEAARQKHNMTSEKYDDYWKLAAASQIGVEDAEIRARVKLWSLDSQMEVQDDEQEGAGAEGWRHEGLMREAEGWLEGGEEVEDGAVNTDGTGVLRAEHGAEEEDVEQQGESEAVEDVPEASLTHAGKPLEKKQQNTIASHPEDQSVAVLEESRKSIGHINHEESKRRLLEPMEPKPKEKNSKIRKVLDKNPGAKLGDLSHQQVEQIIRAIATETKVSAPEESRESTGHASDAEPQRLSPNSRTRNFAERKIQARIDFEEKTGLKFADVTNTRARQIINSLARELLRAELAVQRKEARDGGVSTKTSDTMTQPGDAASQGNAKVRTYIGGEESEPDQDSASPKSTQPENQRSRRSQRSRDRGKQHTATKKAEEREKRAREQDVHVSATVKKDGTDRDERFWGRQEEIAELEMQAQVVEHQRDSAESKAQLEAYKRLEGREMKEGEGDGKGLDGKKVVSTPTVTSKPRSTSGPNQSDTEDPNDKTSDVEKLHAKQVEATPPRKCSGLEELEAMMEQKGRKESRKTVGKKKGQNTTPPRKSSGLEELEALKEKRARSESRKAVGKNGGQSSTGRNKSSTLTQRAEERGKEQQVRDLRPQDLTPRSDSLEDILHASVLRAEAERRIGSSAKRIERFAHDDASPFDDLRTRKKRSEQAYKEATSTAQDRSNTTSGATPTLKTTCQSLDDDPIATQTTSYEPAPSSDQLTAPPRPSDSLHLQVSASDRIRIDDDFTFQLNTSTLGLQQAVVQMQSRLKMSYPRIDTLPYDISESENRKTLQTWLKILVTRWRARQDRNEGEGGKEGETEQGFVKLVLDHMVRDHDLDNEAAQRVAGKWMDAVEKRDRIDEDDWRAGGMGFLTENEGDGSEEVADPWEVDEGVGKKDAEEKSTDEGEGSEGVEAMVQGNAKKMSWVTIVPNRRTYSTSSRPPLDPTLAPNTSQQNAANEIPRSEQAPPPSPQQQHLPHLTPTGSAHMVSVSSKPHTTRTAIAIGTVSFSNPTPLSLIHTNALKKGDVLSVSRIAGIIAAKKCPDIVPLCHPIALTSVGVELRTFDSPASSTSTRDGNDLGFGGVQIEARVSCTGPTGVEMEALTGVMGAALSVVDMCKAVDRGQVIWGVRVVSKEGGRSGGWREEGWGSWQEG